MKTENQPTLSELELEFIRGGVRGPENGCREGGCDPDGNIELNPPPAGCGDPRSLC